MLFPRGKKHLYKHQASPSVLIINLIEALMAASEKPEARTTEASSLVLKINKLNSKRCPGQGTLVLICSCLHNCPSPVPPSASPPLGAPPSSPLLQPPSEPVSASPFAVCLLPTAPSYAELGHSSMLHQPWEKGWDTGTLLGSLIQISSCFPRGFSQLLGKGFPVILSWLIAGHCS